MEFGVLDTFERMHDFQLVSELFILWLELISNYNGLGGRGVVLLVAEEDVVQQRTLVR